MEKELVSSISESIEQILTEIGFNSIQKNKKESGSVEVVTSIGITGDVKATLMIKTNTQSAVKIANKMLLTINPNDIKN